MCRLSAEDGVEHIVATPHANDRYPYDREYLNGARAHLQKLVGESPRIGLGCDFHLSYDTLQDVLVRPGRCTIAATKYLLVVLTTVSILPQRDAEHVRQGETA